MSVFELDIKKFTDKAKGNVDKVVKKIAFETFRRVIEKSPVDTGRFKSNWQVQIGSMPTFGTLGLPESVTHSEGKETDRGSMHRREMAGKISMSKVVSETLKFESGQVIYMVNNLHYAMQLEYGHSKQAPDGMVRITILEFDLISKNAANGTRS